MYNNEERGIRENFRQSISYSCQNTETTDNKKIKQLKYSLIIMFRNHPLGIKRCYSFEFYFQLNPNRTIFQMKVMSSIKIL